MQARISIKSYLKGDYDKKPIAWADENKANQSQFVFLRLRFLPDRRGEEYANVGDRGRNSGIQDSDSNFFCCNCRESADSFVTDGLALGDLLPFAVFLHINGEFCYSLAKAADLLLEHYDVECFLAGQRYCQLRFGGPVGRHPAGIGVAVEGVGGFEGRAARG